MGCGESKIQKINLTSHNDWQGDSETVSADRWVTMMLIKMKMMLLMMMFHNLTFLLQDQAAVGSSQLLSVECCQAQVSQPDQDGRVGRAGHEGNPP